MNAVSHIAERVRGAEWVRRTGRVTRIIGLGIESQGPSARLGELCEVRARSGTILAEVVGFSNEKTLLMPFSDLSGCEAGCEVVATGELAVAKVGHKLLGQVLDAFGKSLDSGQVVQWESEYPLYPEAINPLTRGAVTTVLETGVRALDALLPMGRGQRVGIFSGSGVGKSTLLGMIARNITADVSVVALVGERGREVKAFVDEVLTGKDRERTVIIAATSDQPPLVRRRAAFFATAVAEFFRDQGLHVSLLMDSVTRVAMAQREIGLAAGELPTARGYTPSVFALLPRLLERGGVRAAGGSLTAIYSVLVEGDDVNDPIADTVRAILDGHVVLSRSIAHRGRYPSIDVLQSVSRLSSALATEVEMAATTEVIKTLAAYEAARDLIEVGAYRAGAKAETDRAIALYPDLEEFIRQGAREREFRGASCKRLRDLLARRPTNG